MHKLVETRLQKVILLIGGLLILIRLSGVNYYQTYTAVLQAVGIAVITFVLLILTKDYKPEIHRKAWRIIKKYWYVFALVILVAVGFYAYYIYAKDVAAQQFHISEVAYQNCLDKIAAQDAQVGQRIVSYKASLPPSEYIPISSNNPFANLFGPTPNQQSQNEINQIEQQSYTYQWEQAGRPGYNQAVGFWEVSLVNWVMQNHPDFCSESDTQKIESFLTQKMVMINKSQ
jgi:hypothetical protein